MLRTKPFALVVLDPIPRSTRLRSLPRLKADPILRRLPILALAEPTGDHGLVRVLRQLMNEA